MMQSFSFIRFEVVGPVGWLEFNRPLRNAFARNAGLRADLLLLNEPLAATLVAAGRNWEYQPM